MAEDWKQSTMGEFHDAVSTLLKTFSRGIAIIKSQRGRRKQENLSLDSTRKKAETHLSKSLKKNKVTVKDVYRRELSQVGPGFAEGDGRLSGVVVVQEYS